MRHAGGALLCAVVIGAGCAAMRPMPTPPRQVQTTNVTAPTFEHRPPPLPDAAAPEVGGRNADAGTRHAPPPDGSAVDVDAGGPLR